MRRSLLFCLQGLIFILFAQADVAAQQLSQQLFDTYERYQEPTIQDRRFKHEDIVPLIQKVAKHPAISVKKEGKSIEGRDIFLVKMGNGSTSVLLWSQMHGDEPTATMAIMDLFKFFSASDEFDGLRQKILNKLTLYFIPMLNPDGAERFQRRNAVGVDLNRDALRLQNPEARLLKRIRDELNADWGFNLHDQSRYYAAGRGTDATATISFLAPAYNYAKDTNPVRSRAMQLIVRMNEMLQQYMPKRVARYSDAFEPRAFGDNITKWGTSTILIESGGYPGDREKQYIRKMNYLALLTAFESIAGGSYERENIADYRKIPYNSRGLHDLILRQANVPHRGKNYVLDIAFQRQETDVNQARDFYITGEVTDIGDLSTSHAYEEFDASDYTVVPGKLYPVVFETITDAYRNPVEFFLNDGYTAIQLMKLPPLEVHDELPLQLVPMYEQPDFQVQMGANPSFLLQKDGKNQYVLVNGKLYDLGKL